jgi:hypothetical protein
MLTQDPRSTKAARARIQEIPVYHSSVPRKRPATKLIVAMLMAVLFGAVVGTSAAYPGTDYSDNDTSMILAQQSQPGGPGTRPGPPPREALEACADQTSGSTCSFSGPDGQQISGTCDAPEVNVPLACTPADRPGHG